MVDTLKYPSESSSAHSVPLLHTLSSSSVTNSEQQPHPSHNIESYSNQNTNSHTHHHKTYSTNSKRSKKSLTYQKVSSSHEPHRASSSHHYTMRGGGFVVDLLSAFGILHNISVHEPNVVLRPGAHSSAPAALFSSSYQSDSGSLGLRDVRLDLSNFKNEGYSFRSQSTSPISNNVSTYRFVKIKLIDM